MGWPAVNTQCVDRSKAEIPDEHLAPRSLGEMLVPQLRALLERGNLDLLIPAGALEQHGPHLPLATDSIIAEAIAERVSERVGDLLTAPCLPVGCSDHHLSFPGTASLPRQVASKYLASMTRTLLGHGFRTAYLFSAHAGNIPALNEVVELLAEQGVINVVAVQDWPGQRQALHDWAGDELGLSAERVGSHAGHFETSIMLHLRPELVDMSAAPEGFIGSSQQASETMNRRGMEAVSEVGVIGDPRSATASAGEGYLEVLVSSVAGFIEEHRTVRAGKRKL
jgi:creatinine amidohydrolase/Fe(II)-dependent formamide hydrolase-like protein